MGDGAKLRVMKCYYFILGLDNDCDPEEIKTAYRKLVKTMHPDVGGDPDKFREIKNAYDVLSDPERRKDYDDKVARTPFHGRPYKTIAPVVISEPVDVFDDIVDVFSRRFGIEKKTRIKADLIITEDEARSGMNLELPFPIEMICQRCFGFGTTIISDCRECGGKGSVVTRKMAYVTVGPGARDGDIVVIRSGNLEITGKIRVGG